MCFNPPLLLSDQIPNCLRLISPRQEMPFRMVLKVAKGLLNVGEFLGWSPLGKLRKPIM